MLPVVRRRRSRQRALVGTREWSRGGVGGQHQHDPPLVEVGVGPVQIVDRERELMESDGVSVTTGDPWVVENQVAGPVISSDHQVVGYRPARLLIVAFIARIVRVAQPVCPNSDDYRSALC